MSLPVCKFYLTNNKCKFGDNCRFIHSINQNPPPPFKTTDSENHGEAVNTSLPVLSSSSARNSFNQPESLHHEVLVEQLALSSLNPSATPFHFNRENDEKKYEAVKDQRPSKQKPTQRKICKYFAQHGTCTFGRNCFFTHAIQNESATQHQHDPSNRGHRSHVKPRDVAPRFQRQQIRKTESSAVSISSKDVKEEPTPDDLDLSQTQNTDLPNPKGKTKPRRQCYLFKLGRCTWGKHCKFSHDLNKKQDVSVASPSQSKGQINEDNSKTALSEHSVMREITRITRPNCSRPVVLKQILKLDELEKEGNDQFRELDINYLKKRFPKGSNIILQDENSFVFQAKFLPSNPDWSFDITAFNLEFTLPELYPKEVMTVNVLGEEEFPETVRRYMEISITEWLMERHISFADKGKAELVARPFLRWFDRKLEDMVTEALQQLKRELIAKAAGLEFIPAEKLRARYMSESGSADKEGSGGSNDEEIETGDDTEGSDDDSYSSNGSESEEEDERCPSLNLDPERRGTEISLRHLQLKEKATSLLFERLKLILQCSRCKNHEDAIVTPGKILSTSCGQCSHEMLATYRASLAHQFSSVIGYLDLENCTAFDLILQDCKAGMTCLNCSKQTRVEGLVSGQLIDGWCQACNARFKIATEAVKFSKLAPSGVDVSGNTQIEIVRQKTNKPPKDPHIKEGCPLPDFGTCKHYKQSYRWLRFPCCGKAYPCDVCHDKKEDHEMVFANRMICGHCCKEQTFSPTRPCKECGESLTKTHTSHWEGGHGCRNKIAMSKNDNQKYKSMNKTTSNHKKKVQPSGSKKKTTKLRHV